MCVRARACVCVCVDAYFEDALFNRLIFLSSTREEEMLLIHIERMLGALY